MITRWSAERILNYRLVGLRKIPGLDLMTDEAFTLNQQLVEIENKEIRQ